MPVMEIDAEIEAMLADVHPVEEETEPEGETLEILTPESMPQEVVRNQHGGRKHAAPGYISKDGKRKKNPDGTWSYIPTGRKRGRPKKETPKLEIPNPTKLNGEGLGLRSNREVEEMYKHLKSIYKTDPDTIHHLVRWRARNDLFWFGNTFLGLGNYINPNNQRKRVDPVFHLWLCGELEHRESTLLLLPRDHGKSSWVSVMAAQDVLRDPDNVRTLLISASAMLVEGLMKAIVAYFIQPSVLHYFQDIVPEPGRNFINWDTKRAMDLTIKRNPARVVPQHQITGCPYGALITGAHFEHIICDDIIDKKTSNTALLRQKAAERVMELQNIVDPVGRTTVIGTRYAVDDVYGRMMGTTIVKRQLVRQATEVPLYKNKKLEPLPEGVDSGSLDDPNSKCIYSFYDKDMLHEKRANTAGMDGGGNVSYFYSQFYNQPRAPEEILFRPPIRTYQNIPPSTKENCKRFIAVDTANTTHDHSDYSGITVVYRAKAGFCYIEECVALKDNWEGVALQIIRLALKHHPIKEIAVETTLAEQWMVVYRRAVEIMIQSYKEQKRDFPSLPIPQMVVPTKQASKRERIDMLFGANYRTESCIIQADQRDLIEQMLDFPVGKHDDLVDSTATCLGLANPIGGRSLFYRLPVEEEKRDLIRDYLTGRSGNKGWKYGNDFANYQAS